MSKPSKARQMLDALYAERADAQRQADRKPLESFELCGGCHHNVHEVEAQCARQEAQRRIDLVDRLIAVLVP